MKRSSRRLVAAGIALVASIAAYLLAGEQFIGVREATRALIGSGETEHALIVGELRAPRLVLAILVGASLAVAGAMLQSVFRNPLAAPDLIGVSGGAGAAAAGFLALRAASASIHLLPLFAMGGAAIVATAIYSFAWKRGVDPVRLVLVGIGIGALAGACTNVILVLGSEYTAISAYVWLTGTVYGVSWKQTLALLPWTAGLLLLAALSVRRIDVLMLTDDTATGVGSAVERNRRWLIAIAVGLAGSAVAFAGIVGFVGLIGPHIARHLVGPGAARLLPMSALCGALIVVLADTAGRTLFLPYDIPVGVLTSAVGAPFFVYLLYKKRQLGR